MDLHFWSTILLFLSPFITFLLLKQQNSPKKSSKLPPSPPRLPVIGHLHLLLRSGLPHHALKRVSDKYGPVAHLQLGEITTIVISSREATGHVLKTRDPVCADRADSIGTRIMWYDNTDLIFSPYGPHWRQLRKICVSDLLSPRNLASFAQIRQDEASRLILSLKSTADQAVNFTKRISATTCAIVCRAAFGRVMEDSDVMVKLMKEASTMATGFELADLFPSSKILNLLCWNKYRLWGMRRRVDAILEPIVEEHRRKQSGEFGGEDIIDVLLRMQKDDNLQVPLTTNTIKGFIFDTFSAGIETSSATTIWVMAELMRNPTVMAKAQKEVREVLKGQSDVQELKYLRSVVKETMRLHPPFPLIPRKCREEFELNGYIVPVESRVTVNLWAMGRDPLYWEEPEVFCPERFEGVSTDFMGNDFEFIPFGAGRRICPGLNFGLGNIEVPLAQLLYHFDWKLPQGMSCADVDMAEINGLSGAKKNALLLVPTLYNPST